MLIPVVACLNWSTTVPCHVASLVGVDGRKFQQLPCLTAPLRCPCSTSQSEGEGPWWPACSAGQAATLQLAFDTASGKSKTVWCRMFEMMSEYDLLLAHPSLCSELESLSLQLTLLKRQPVNKLRYTTAVDILAPIFDMTFFQDTVVQTLQDATYGERQSNGCSDFPLNYIVQCCSMWPNHCSPLAVQPQNMGDHLSECLNGHAAA